MCILKKSLPMAVAAFLLPACAFVDNEIQLEYQVVSAVPAGGSSGTVFMSLLEDSRPDKSKVGVIRNTYGMETAKVLTTDDPAVWVSNTLKGTLERSGYKVETVDKNYAPVQDQFYLSGTLSRVNSNPEMGFWTVTVRGEVEAHLRAEINGRQKQKLITGRSETESLVSTGGDLHKGSLNNALSDFVEQVLAWLRSLRT